MNNILLVGSQHGNELLGEKLYEHIKLLRPKLLGHVEYILANPAARKRERRFIEADMNRSYTGSNSTYEERMANRILRKTANNRYALILDMHTTTVDQEPCMILAGITNQNRQFIRSTKIQKLVHMKHKMVENSLIGHRQECVSIEVSEPMLHDELFDSLCDDMELYLNGLDYPNQKEIYEIIGTIKKSQLSGIDLSKLKNFTQSPYGFTPVLYGEAAYEDYADYLGFKATYRGRSKV